MKKLLSIMFLFLVVMAGCKKKRVEQERMCARIDMDRIVELMPKTTEEVELQTQQIQEHMLKVINDIEGIAPECRTYLNTVLAYEQAYLLFFTRMQIFSVLATLSDNAQLQLSANLAAQELQTFKATKMDTNSSIYQAFHEYHMYGCDAYHATRPVQNFLHHMDQKALFEGVRLSIEEQHTFVELKQQIQKLEGQYYSHVLYDKRHIAVDKDALEGVPANVLTALHVDEQGNYVLPTDWDIYFGVMENCHNQVTRKAYYEMFGQIAYPQNETVLKELIGARMQLAQTLGFADFASMQLHNLMMKTPKRVEQFLLHLSKELQPYVKLDYQKMLRNLPKGVSVDASGKLAPWDDAYVKSYYRKKFFNIDDAAIAEYFPLETILPAILRQFQRVFFVTFDLESTEGLWAPDVICYRVRSMKNQAIIGYLMFDVYQRVGKRVNDAMHITMIPAIRDDCSIACVGASVIAAQFNRVADKPTLLEFSDVITLFHEIGHGLHAIFGATRFTAFSGTQVVQDFVETPSMMLEYWFDEPEMLRSISSHVVTGKPLSKDQIEHLLAAQKFGRAGRMLQQVYLSLLSLQLFQADIKDSPEKLAMRLYKKLFQFVAYDPHFHVETSFIHLAQQYAAAYYAYPLSAVIGADLFKHLKQHGLWEHSAGTRYVEEILSPGGSAVPSFMLKKYLGRSFTLNAYLALL